MTMPNDKMSAQEEREATELLDGPLSLAVRRGIKDVIEQHVPDIFSNADNSTILIYALMKVAGGVIGISVDHLPPEQQIARLQVMLKQAAEMLSISAVAATKYKKDNR